MTDTLSKKDRSRTMRAVKSKGSKIEKYFIKELRRRQLYFRSNANKLYGRPDIVFKKYRVVVFLDSCFWHGCSYHCRMPKANKKYWNEKILRNKKRDQEVKKWYKNNGWIAYRFWEHSLIKNCDACIDKISEIIIKMKKECF